MKSFEYTIKDELGIHARPAGLLAKEAKKYSSVCMIEKVTMALRSFRSLITRSDRPNPFS